MNTVDMNISLSDAERTVVCSMTETKETREYEAGERREIRGWGMGTSEKDN
jgi:hypothetical protein